MSQESLSRQQQLEQLQAELASRRSIVHFAHTGVSLVWAAIVAGAAAKLFHDSLRTPLLAYLATLVAVGLGVYGLVHLRRGRRAARQELERFALLQQLRAELKLDDPSALLPG